MVIVDYVAKAALQANVTFATTVELDSSVTSPSSIATFQGYLRGFRGAGMPHSAEKVAIAVLKKHGAVIISASSSDSNQLCCEFAPSYSQR